jgi:hypothetical protein
MRPHSDFSKEFIWAFEDICKKRKIQFEHDAVSRALITTIFEEMRESTDKGRLANV